MTTEGPPSSSTPPPAGSATSPRPLRRRRTDRVIGGVAGGIADYLNVDPVLVRAVFVGLMIFGGSGLVLYVIGWLLIPAEGEPTSPGESFIRGLGLTPRAVLIAFGIIAFVVFLGSLGDSHEGTVGTFVRTLAFLLVALAGLWILARVTGSGGVAPAAETTVAAAPPADGAPARVTVRREPPSPLGLYTLAAMLIGVGVLALVGRIGDVRLDPADFFGVALGILGLGLLVGAWWGRARWLVLVGLVLLPFAWASTHLTVPLEGGMGDVRFTPTSASEVRDEYRLVGGRLLLDLRDLAGIDPVALTASIGFGEILVLLPPDAETTVTSSVGAGSSSVFGSFQDGTRLEDEVTEGRGREIALRLEAGIGQITVHTPEEDAP